jgi:cell division protein FtsB
MSRELVNDSDHRRGLVLGLTLAEILILLLFLLMLALGARLSAMSAQIKEAARENESLRAASDSLKPLVEALNRSGSIPVDDIRSLVDRLGRLAQLEKAVDDLRRKNQHMETSLAILRDLGPDAPQKLRSLDRVFAAAARIDPSDPPAVLTRALATFERLGQLDAEQTSALAELAKRLDLSPTSMKELMAAMASAAKIDPRDPAGALKRSAEVSARSGGAASLSELQAKLEAGQAALNATESERDRLKLEKENLMKGGRGLMYPSCWIAPNGDTEYIFDIMISDTGLTVSNAAPAYRMKHEAWAQIDPFQVDKEIGEGVFRNSTSRLNAWSRQRDCRFVVIMRDATGPQSKERYKQLQRIIEGHFYVRRMERVATRGTPSGPMPTQTDGRSPADVAPATPAPRPPSVPIYDPGRVE